MSENRNTHLSRRYNSELYHYGIKGQKWGVRGFQNADRTWTAAGKERYGRKKNVGTIKSGEPGVLAKHQLRKTFDISDEEMKNIDLKNFDPSKYKVKHDTNSTFEAKKFIATLALDTLVPGYQVYLPFDIYRGAKAINSSVKSKKYSKEREANPIDEKTGFHLKTENLSEKEDLKRVNPEFNDFNSNTKSNCVLCTMTCEMRRRGYDVTAKKAGVGYFDHELTNFFKDYKVEHIDSPKYAKKFRDPDADKGANLYSGGGKEFAQRAINKIVSSQPEGSRGNLSVNWGGQFGGGGHSMFYEIRNGSLIVFDGQSGKIYNNPEKILKNCTSIDIGRLDNLKFDKNGIKECCK